MKPRPSASASALTALLAVAAPNLSAEPTPTITLEAIEVVGQHGTSYHHAESAAATRSEAPLREVPQAVRVLPAQLIDDLGALRLGDTLDYVSGVSRQNNFGGTWDNFAIRGLAGHEDTGMSFLLNGFAGNRGFNAPRDTANVDRIEFLKGPAAALYGSSEPGGTVNIVTKKPRFDAAHTAEATLGSDALRRVTVDTTGPLSERMAYRINAAVEERDSFRDHMQSERRLFAPALSWILGRDTMLNYEAEYLRQQAPLDRGVIAVDGRVGSVPRHRFLGEPGDGAITIENLTHQLTLDHQLDAAWRTRLGVAYKTGTLEGHSTEARPRLDGDLLWRQRRYRDFRSDDLAVQAELAGSLRTGAIGHELLVGAEAYRFELDQLMLRVNGSAAHPYAIDIHRPVYGQTPPALLPNIDTRERQRGSAWFVQDQIALGAQWRLLAGLRIDRFAQHIDNLRTAGTSRQDHVARSPRVGLSYLASPQLSLYLSAGETFRPNAGLDRAGAAFAPERGRALEAGLKYESADRRLGATAAVFEIRKRNVLTRDPADSSHAVAAGEVRSRGLEFDLAGQLDRHWRLSTSFAFIDAEVSRDNDPALAGKPLSNVPRLSASALLVREAPLAGDARYGIGGGLSHVGRRPGDTLDSFTLPAYTTAKLLAYWQLDRQWRLALDVDNLFDKRYYASAYDRWWVTPGSARSVSLSLQARF